MNARLKHAPRESVAVFLAVSTFSVTVALAQSPAAASTESTSGERILGVIPNFLTVEDPQQRVRPLTVKQKFGLFAKETFDPFTPFPQLPALRFRK